MTQYLLPFPHLKTLLFIENLLILFIGLGCDLRQGHHRFKEGVVVPIGAVYRHGTGIGIVWRSRRGSNISASLLFIRASLQKGMK